MNIVMLAKSKTIIGILVAMFVQLSPEFGLNFGAGDGALITNGVDSVITAISGIFAVYGRVVAKGPIVQ